MYWGLGDEAQVVSAWFAIDDSRPDNGRMRAVAGSNHFPRQPHGKAGENGENLLSISQNIELSPEQEADIVDLELEPGQYSFHDGWVIHGSHANTADRRRCGITAIFAPASVGYSDEQDEETKKSMSSDTSAAKHQKGTTTPWSEGYLVSGSAEGSAVNPTPHPFPMPRADSAKL